MAKASLILPDGTKVDIEGNPEEIKKILSMHNLDGQKPKQEKRRGKTESSAAGVNLAEIVNKIKSCKEADLIEKNILDRNGQVDRILLPLYIVYTYFPGSLGLTSGEISKILSQLNICIQTPNISKTLSSKASKYVLGDKIRKKGQPVRYRISRKGLRYIGSVIKGKTDERS